MAKKYQLHSRTYICTDESKLPEKVGASLRHYKATAYRRGHKIHNNPMATVQPHLFDAGRFTITVRALVEPLKKQPSAKAK